MTTTDLPAQASNMSLRLQLAARLGVLNIRFGSTDVVHPDLTSEMVLDAVALNALMASKHAHC